MAGAVGENRLVTAPLFLRRGHLIERMQCLLMEYPVSQIRLLSSYVSIISTLGAAIFFAVLSFPLSGEPLIQQPVSPIAMHIGSHEPILVPTQGNRSVGDHIYTINAGVVAPFVISQVEPQYSDNAREEHIQGSVLLEGIVETDGSITVTHVGRGLEPTLDRNARHAIEQWRFAPGR
jgi:TonB family protein